MSEDAASPKPYGLRKRTRRVIVDDLGEEGDRRAAGGPASDASSLTSLSDSDKDAHPEPDSSDSDGSDAYEDEEKVKGKKTKPRKFVSNPSKTNGVSPPSKGPRATQSDQPIKLGHLPGRTAPPSGPFTASRSDGPVSGEAEHVGAHGEFAGGRGQGADRFLIWPDTAGSYSYKTPHVPVKHHRPLPSNFIPPPLPTVWQLFARAGDVVQNARVQATRGRSPATYVLSGRGRPSLIFVGADESLQVASQTAIEGSIQALPGRAQQAALCLTMKYAVSLALLDRPSLTPAAEPVATPPFVPRPRSTSPPSPSLPTKSPSSSLARRPPRLVLRSVNFCPSPRRSICPSQTGSTGSQWARAKGSA
jgi:hypothetical protein